MDAPEEKALTIGPTSGDHLRITVVEVVPEGQQGAGDFNASVSVFCDGFTATECSFWILRSSFDEFLVALSSFETSRAGHATLESMSPGEFILTIASESPARWPTVTGTVTRPYLGRARAYRGQLTFAFVLDSSFIVQLQHDFDHLIPNDRGA